MNETVEEIQCLLNFHWEASHHGIEIYTCIRFCLHSVFLCQFHAHIYLYCLLPRNDILLNLKLFIRSHNLISLPSFMFVSAVVSEIRELNQNKKEKKKAKPGPLYTVLLYCMILKVSSNNANSNLS